MGGTGAQGGLNSQGAQGTQGTQGLGAQGNQGTQGTAGPSTIINAANDTTTTTLYPVMVGATGSNQTAKARSTATAFSFNASTNILTAGGLSVSKQGTLGGTATNTLTVSDFLHNNGNNSILRIKATRNTTGADWTTASTKLLQVIDVTEMGYIEYNPGGSNFGMAFGQGASEWARFLQNGNLGVGITNPGAKLDVSGDIRLSAADPEIEFNNSGPRLKVPAANTLTIHTGGGLNATTNEAVRINTTGVGIGTTNPLQRLHVNGDLLISSSSATATHITQKAYTIDGGTVSWEGSSGQLFSINNDLSSGSIFSVNDISGMPSIDVDANGTIELGPFGGNIGVGTTTVTQKLDVSGNVRFRNALFDGSNSAGTNGQVLISTGSKISWTNFSGGATLQNDVSTNETWYPTLSSATSGTYSTAYVSNTKLQFNPSTGTLSATVFTSLSDETQKTNIRPIENALDLVKQMNGVKYDWKDGHNQSSVGVIAQEIEKVLPEVVTTNDQGLKTVSYGNIIGVLIEAIKEQQNCIEELERKLNA